MKAEELLPTYQNLFTKVGLDYENDETAAQLLAECTNIALRYVQSELEKANRIIKEYDDKVKADQESYDELLSELEEVKEQMLKERAVLYWYYTNSVSCEGTDSEKLLLLDEMMEEYEKQN